MKEGSPQFDPDYQPYDGRRLSYAVTFTNPVQRRIIRLIELLTAKRHLLKAVRRFEALGVPIGQNFFTRALEVMDIRLDTPEAEIARIPKSGPLIVTANHPHGLVDGIVLAELIGRVRTDYKILTRSLLTGVTEVDPFMIPVPFAHDEDALERNLEMRRAAMAHLKDGGVIVLFPAGVVASSDTPFGPVIERKWNPFTAKMVLRSGATVLPVRFPGQNSRAYQIAASTSSTLRQGLLLYEVKHAMGKAQRPYFGQPIPPTELEDWRDNPSGLTEWLRQTVMNLGPQN